MRRATPRRARQGSSRQPDVVGSRRREICAVRAPKLNAGATSPPIHGRNAAVTRAAGVDPLAESPVAGSGGARDACSADAESTRDLPESIGVDRGRYWASRGNRNSPRRVITDQLAWQGESAESIVGPAVPDRMDVRSALNAGATRQRQGRLERGLIAEESARRGGHQCDRPVTCADEGDDAQGRKQRRPVHARHIVEVRETGGTAPAATATT